MARTLRAQALTITRSQHKEKLDRHEASLTAAHGKLDRIIGMLDRLVNDDKGNAQ